MFKKTLLRKDYIPDDMCWESYHVDILKKKDYWVIRLALFLTTLVLSLIMFMFSGCVAQAYTVQDAVKSCIGEAEGEGYDGMLAIASAIRNRGSLHGVYGLHSKRVRFHLYSQKTYNLALKAWHDSARVDVTNGAIGWGNVDDINKFCSQTWWRRCVITAHIGNHYFYKIRNDD